MRGYRLVLSLVLVAAPLSAQALTTDIGIRDIGTPQVTLRDRIEGALALPLRTAEMRALGIHDGGIRRLLEAMQARNLPTSEQLEVLATARDAVLEGKPHADFGAFVQGRLDAGLRGASLAQAIHLERLRRTPDSPTVVALAFADEPPAVSQLPDATHPRRAGQVRRYKGTWGRHP